jgi:ABC-type transporter Mla subunit MlaD
MSHRFNNFVHHVEKVLQVLILAAVAFAMISVGLLALSARKAITDTKPKLQMLILHADAAVAEARGLTADTRTKVFEKGGLADITKKTLLHVDQVSGETAITARAQRKYWNQTGDEVVKLVGNMNRTVLSVNDTQAQIGRDLHSVALAVVESTDHVAPLLDQGTATLKSAQGLVDDPSVKQTLDSVAATSANIEGTTGSLASIAHTVDVKVDKLAHPSKFQQAVTWGITFGRTVGSFGWLF